MEDPAGLTTGAIYSCFRGKADLLLEDIAMDFPDIRMIVAHLGHPWEEDLVALIRKAPNMYADISAVHYRPWRYWQAMVTAMDPAESKAWHPRRTCYPFGS